MWTKGDRGGMKCCKLCLKRYGLWFVCLFVHVCICMALPSCARACLNRVVACVSCAWTYMHLCVCFLSVRTQSQIACAFEWTGSTFRSTKSCSTTKNDYVTSVRLSAHVLLDEELHDLCLHLLNGCPGWVVQSNEWAGSLSKQFYGEVIGYHCV